MGLRRVLVTGGSGFIGVNLVEALIRKGETVLNADIHPPRNPAQTSVWRAVNLCDKDALLKVFADFRPDVVFHLGARTDLLGKSLVDYAANTIGVENTILAARATRSIRIIFFASSRLVCRIGYQPKFDADYCPPNSYGESKVETEKIVRAAKLEIPWCLFRPTSIWGPWFDIPYKDFFLHVAKGRYIHPAGKKIHKSFGYVGNSVHQLLTLAEGDPAVYNGKTFYLCDYPPLEVGEWADEIATEMGVRRPMRVSNAILKPIALAGDALKLAGMKNPPLTSFRLNNLNTEMLHETGFLENAVGSLPFTRTEGVRRTVAWLRERGEIGKA